jgi:hypothetical protein
MDPRYQSFRALMDNLVDGYQEMHGHSPFPGSRQAYDPMFYEDYF